MPARDIARAEYMDDLPKTVRQANADVMEQILRDVPAEGTSAERRIFAEATGQARPKASNLPSRWSVYVVEMADKVKAGNKTVAQVASKPEDMGKIIPKDLAKAIMEQLQELAKEYI